jgi:hypothetical protein
VCSQTRWLDGAAAPWLDLSIWEEGEQAVTLEDIPAGTRAWLGVDLSSTQDLTAVVAVLEQPAGGFLAIPKFFVPEDGIRRRSGRDGVPYVSWPSRATSRLRPARWSTTASSRAMSPSSPSGTGWTRSPRPVEQYQHADQADGTGPAGHERLLEEG